jgi:Polyphosphate kinase 2 (PPK2)
VQVIAVKPAIVTSVNLDVNFIEKPHWLLNNEGTLSSICVNCVTLHQLNQIFASSLHSLNLSLNRHVIVTNLVYGLTSVNSLKPTVDQDMTKKNEQIIQRICEELKDSYDEELELEHDDQNTDEIHALLATETDEYRENRRVYFRELFRMQAELVKLQDWIVKTGKKVVILFEGRDAAGKGGVIKRITQRLNPRVCRVAALAAPNDREKTQWYFQRFIAHLPAAGEIVLFDRSWYNRAGVERVMGFCDDEQYEEFFRTVPRRAKYTIFGPYP